MPYRPPKPNRKTEPESFHIPDPLQLLADDDDDEDIDGELEAMSQVDHLTQAAGMTGAAALMAAFDEDNAMAVARFACAAAFSAAALALDNALEMASVDEAAATALAEAASAAANAVVGKVQIGDDDQYMSLEDAANALTVAAATVKLAAEAIERLAVESPTAEEIFC